MPGRSGVLWLIVGLQAVVLVLLAVFVFQIDTLEQRFILQGKQLRALAESSDRLRGEVAQIRRGGVVASAPGAEDDPGAGAKLYRPELPNLLEPEDFSFASAGARYDGTIAKPWASGDPKGFNLLKENAADLSNLAAYVSSSLARRHQWTDPDRWAGDLAWRVEVGDDYKEFTVYLRRGVKWHRPSVDLDDPRYAWLDADHEVTARDVVFTLDMLMHPQVENGFLKSYYEHLSSWEALDDYTVRLRWGKKLYTNIASTLGIQIVPEFLFAYDERGERIPEEVLGLKFNQHWYNNRGLVGTGPYRFDEYESGSRIRLLRNEDWFGERPPIREVLYPIFTDPNKQLLLLKSNEVQFGGLRPGQYRDEILRWKDVPAAERPADNPFVNGEITCERQLSFAFYYLGWNADKPIFADRRVRRAMTHAVDRQRIIDSVFVGLGSVATGPFYRDSPYRDASIQPLAFDPERAAALLGEAGWVDSDGDGLRDRDLTPDDGDPTRTPFQFSLLIYGSSPEFASLANILKEDLLRIGVKMDIDSAEWSLMQKKMDDREFDAFTGGWALGWDVDFYQIWHSSQADVPKGSNKVGFRNEEADEIILALREAFEREERIALSHRFHRLIHEEQPYTFLHYPESVACWRKAVRNVIFARMRPQSFSLPWWVASE